MKNLTYIDPNSGYKYKYALPDGFSGEDNSKIKLGIPQDYIDLSKVNWAEFKKALHNSLVDAGLSNMNTLKSPNGNRMLQQIVCRQLSVELLRQLTN